MSTCNDTPEDVFEFTFGRSSNIRMLAPNRLNCLQPVNTRVTMSMIIPVP